MNGPSKVEITRAIDTIENRLQVAADDYNDITMWNEEDYLGCDSFIGTYQEWVDDAFDDLRVLLGVGI